MRKPVFLCVDGILVKDRKILLLKRNVEPFKGYWHVVGGHVEETETLRDALKREFREETGLNISVGNLIGGRIEKSFDRVKIIAGLEVNQASGQIKCNHENTEFGWFESMPPESVFDYSKYFKSAV